MREVTGEICVFVVQNCLWKVVCGAEFGQFLDGFADSGTGKSLPHNREFGRTDQGTILGLSGTLLCSEPALPSAIDGFGLVVVFIVHLGIEQDQGKAAALPQHLLGHRRDLAGIAQAQPKFGLAGLDSRGSAFGQAVYPYRSVWHWLSGRNRDPGEQPVPPVAAQDLALARDNYRDRLAAIVDTGARHGFLADVEAGCEADNVT